MNLLFIIRGRILIKKIICFLFVILFFVSCNNFKNKNSKNERIFFNGAIKEDRNKKLSEDLEYDVMIGKNEFIDFNKHV